MGIWGKIVCSEKKDGIKLGVDGELCEIRDK